ncbi:unnamed protein product, partial [Choristocarpus tenellus]
MTSTVEELKPENGKTNPFSDLDDPCKTNCGSTSQSPSLVGLGSVEGWPLTMGVDETSIHGSKIEFPDADDFCNVDDSGNVVMEADLGAGVGGEGEQGGDCVGGRLRSACDGCSTKKIKCDGCSPCNPCKKRGAECHFSVKRPTGPKKLFKFDGALSPTSNGSSGAGKLFPESPNSPIAATSTPIPSMSSQSTFSTVASTASLAAVSVLPTASTTVSPMLSSSSLVSVSAGSPDATHGQGTGSTLASLTFQTPDHSHNVLRGNRHGAAAATMAATSAATKAPIVATTPTGTTSPIVATAATGPTAIASLALTQTSTAATSTASASAAKAWDSGRTNMLPMSGWGGVGG